MTQPNETQQLKPCYCRSSNSSLRIKPWMDHGDFACKPRGYHVFCGNCWACGPTTSTEADAPTAWNKFRAPVDSQGVGGGMSALLGYEQGFGDAATQMRTLCVEKVRELALDYQSLSLSEWFTRYGDERWENVVIPALESLTLEKEQADADIP